MPVVYIHGVARREPDLDERSLGLMKRYLADHIANGDELVVEYAYWGDVAAQFAWGGASRPRTPLLGQGGVGGAIDSLGVRTILAADLAGVLGHLPEPSTAPMYDTPLIPAGPVAHDAARNDYRLRNLTEEELSDFLVALLLGLGQQSSDALVAADDLAREAETSRLLMAADTVDDEWRVIMRLLTARTGRELVGMGSDGWLTLLEDRFKESVGRGTGLPGFVASRLIAEMRAPINALATTFVGDVLAYLNGRGDCNGIGEIPLRLLEALSRAKEKAPNEPLVVVSHSMGGQVTYDVITHFLPKSPAWRGIRIDYWCATASQVGLFEELKLFIESDVSLRAGRRVTFPDRTHLGGWWNVWDHNDFISYTAREIFDDVDDEAFSTGMSLAGAHSGYLLRPSFYRRLAAKLAAAAATGWGR